MKKFCAISILSMLFCVNVFAKTKVVIVGAGLSGLKAAKEIIKSRGQENVEILIFESGQRIGGRVFTHRFSATDAYVEFGATFVNEDHKALIAEIKDSGLELLKLPGKENRTFTYIINGKVYSSHEIFMLTRPYLEEMKKDQTHYEKSIKEFGLSDRSVYTNKTIKEYLLELEKKVSIENNRFELLKKVITSTLADELAQPIEELTVQHLFMQFGIDLEKEMFDPFIDSDEALKIKGGNQLVADKMAEYVQSHGGKIFFSHELLSVEESEQNKALTLSFKDSEGKIINVATDYTILTPSPIALAENVQFNSSEIDKLLEKQNMNRPLGSTTKIVFEYKSAFWREQKIDPRTIGEFFQLWDSSEFTASGDGPYTLTAYLNNKASREYDEFGKSIMGKKVLKDMKPFLPNIEEGLVAVHETVDWQRHRSFGGSYSGAIVEETVSSEIKVSPHVGHIYFAGEAWDNKYAGFMEGAMRTGARASGEISTRLNSLVTPKRDCLSSLSLFLSIR
jgi:monoamine oxidase